MKKKIKLAFVEGDMKEIGGYIELDTYGSSSMHENAIKLNTARNCLAYLIETKKIKPHKITIRDF